jgi:CheY-like chemotaxis protein
MAIDRHQPVNADYIDQILAASDKAAKLTRSLLAFSRKQQITLAPQNLNEVVASTGKLLKRLLTEDIECRVSAASEELIVMADTTQIDQILINLAANARDAMPQGGLLSVETGTARLDHEFIRDHGYGSQGEYALLSVSDTGIGMQKAIQERIFEPFFTTKEVGKGTGLGLATVYGIVKQHNGFITVYSEPGEGTTFHIYLPLVDRETVTEAYSPDEIKDGVETVLIAEDDPDARLLMIETLRTHGYTTIEATDGEDAVKAFEKDKNRIALVVMDVVMPKKNGKEAWEAIRKLRPDATAIFVSGYTRDVVFDKGIEGETVDFVPKPLSANSLLQKVREVLDRAKRPSAKKGRQ